MGSGDTLRRAVSPWHPQVAVSGLLGRLVFLTVVVTASSVFVHPALRPHRPLHFRLPGIHGNEGRFAPAGVHLLLPLQADQPG